MDSLSLNLPNSLTLARLILSPIVIPLLCAYLLPLNIFAINCLLAFLITILSLTDFLDGYLARRYRQETALGRLLDPIADKFLVYSTLIALVYVNKLYFYWAIIFIGREFFIMGLREVSVFYGFTLPSLPMAKLKTWFQMIFIVYVIINPYQHLGLHAPFYNIIEYILLIAALYLSIISAIQYYNIFAKNIRGVQ